MSYAPVGSDMLTRNEKRLKRHKLVMAIANSVCLGAAVVFFGMIQLRYTLLLTRQTFHGSATVTVEFANIVWPGLAVTSFSVSVITYFVFWGKFAVFLEKVRRTELVCVRPIIWLDTAVSGALALPVVLQVNLESDILTLLFITLTWCSTCLCLYFQEHSNTFRDPAPYLLVLAFCLKVAIWIAIIYDYIQSESLTFQYATAVAFAWICLDALQLVLGLCDYLAVLDSTNCYSQFRHEDPVVVPYIYSFLSLIMRLATFLLTFLATQTSSWFDLTA